MGPPNQTMIILSDAERQQINQSTKLKLICISIMTYYHQSSISYTPLTVVSRARKTLRVSTTAGIAQIPAVSSQEGAVIGAVLSTRKFHRGYHCYHVVAAKKGGEFCFNLWPRKCAECLKFMT
jgi:ATP-dependent helicase/DNAse subunit B